MTVLLGLGVFFLGAGFFTKRVAQARQGAWAGPRTSGMRQRASKGGGSGESHRPVRHEIKLLREKARLDNWLKHEEHQRKNGTTAGNGAPAMTGTVLTPLQRAQQRAGALRQAVRSSRPAASNGSAAAAPAAPSRPAGAPTPAPPPAPSPGRNATVATNGSGHAAEKLIEGVNQIQAEASAGGIHAKHAAIKAAMEGAMRFSAMASMLARAMSEPGSNYGPEVTEPLEKASEHMQATAMALSESDANLSTLINMTVGDLANSARQAPHHAELSENGSH